MLHWKKGPWHPLLGTSPNAWHHIIICDKISILAKQTGALEWEHYLQMLPVWGHYFNMYLQLTTPTIWGPKWPRPSCDTGINYQDFTSCFGALKSSIPVGSCFRSVWFFSSERSGAMSGREEETHECCGANANCCCCRVEWAMWGNVNALYAAASE